MIPVDQTLFGRPAANCMQACLASIMELPVESVLPAHVGDGSGYNEGGGSWVERLARAVRAFGLTALMVDVERLRRMAILPGTYCVLFGNSPRAGSPDGTLYHCVVGRWSKDYTMEIVHDPHPSRAGLSPVTHAGFLISG